MAHPCREAQWCFATWEVVGARFIAVLSLGRGNSYAFKNAEVLPVLRCAIQYFDNGRAVLAFPAGVGDMSTQLLGQQLHSVADTQDGQATLQYGGITGGSLFVVDA